MATTTLLGKLDFHNFTIRINDRKILKAMAAVQWISRKKALIQYLSFWTRWTRSVWRALQKNLKKKALKKDSIDTYLGMFNGSDFGSSKAYATAEKN